LKFRGEAFVLYSGPLFGILLANFNSSPLLREFLEFFGYESRPTRKQILEVFKGSNFWRSEDAVIAAHTASEGIEYDDITKEHRDRIFAVIMRLFHEEKLEGCHRFADLPPQEQGGAIFSAHEEQHPGIYTNITNYYRLPRNYKRHSGPWEEENPTL